MRKSTLFLAGIFLVAAAASAKENYKEPAFNADSKDKFESVATGVRSQMEEGGRYQYVSAVERTTIIQKLDDMTALFSKHDSIASMGEQDKIQLFNDQESVNSILTKRDGERVICKKEAPIGSHIPITTCHTYAQEQIAHKANAQQVDQWGRMQCGDNGHGLCGIPASDKSNFNGQAPRTR